MPQSNEGDEPRNDNERLWNEAQKRYLEYFKQMTVLNTASMGVLVALGGQAGQSFLAIPLLGIATALLGFVFSLLVSMVGMFLVVEAPYFGLERQRKLARAAHGFSALAFMVGVLIAVVAAMYVRLGAGYWLWIGLLTVYLVAVAIVLTRYRRAIFPLIDSVAVMTEVLTSSFGGLVGSLQALVSSFDALVDSLQALINNLISAASNLPDRILRFFRRR